MKQFKNEGNDYHSLPFPHQSHFLFPSLLKVGVQPTIDTEELKLKFIRTKRPVHTNIYRYT